MVAREACAALILIDMQQGMRAPAAGERNNPDAEGNMLRLLAAWREAGWPVVHVHHVSRTPGSPFWPGQAGADVQPEFAPAAGEHQVKKQVPDAFVRTGLERWLHARGLRKLVFVGVSTSNSVEATVRSSGNLGFDAIVVSDATFTFAKDDYAGVRRTADEVHAMSLANLAGEYAVVTNTAELLGRAPSRAPHDDARLAPLAIAASVSVITLGVDDLERAVRFYAEGLGFATDGIVGREFEFGAVAFFDMQPGLRLALWPRRSLAHDAGLPLSAPSATEFSLGHNVASREEVDAVMARAQAAGAQIVKAAGDTFWGGYAGYFQDPDRHLWEVVWNPQWQP
jgi:nicotinamidase-related amidase/catechol 2,3-dioxygenase-like lactoylglutathione lyase family enzyme